MKPLQPSRWGAGRILGGFLLAAAASAAWPATYYVRDDGGSASQCNGQANAPYPGSGSGRSCAWKHPFIALPPGGSPRIAGGDTLIIGTGSYRMGHGAPETGSCGASWSWHCHMPPIPSGPSASRMTRILGAGHNSGCNNPPELWGAERANVVLNLEGSSNVELACLEVTDRASCVDSHCHNRACQGLVAACKRDAPPFGDWASTGLRASDSKNVELRDVNIHGLASRGISAGRIENWTLKRVKINANGWAGWDGDIGKNTSANAGTIRFIDSEIAWNGCVENWQSGTKFGCWAQEGGGYGDGLGTAETGGHWIFERSEVHHNTSDGIDLLYLNGSGQVTIRQTLVDSNAGNQIKVARSALIENSVMVGNCSYFANEPNMLGGDQCRALGDTISVGLEPGAQTDLINNTIIGQGNCVISGGGGTSSSRVRFINNLIIATPYWHDPSQQSCLYYSGASEQQVWDRNFIVNPRHRACPGNSICSGTPQIRSASISSFDGRPLPSSPLIGEANASLAPDRDFFNNPRGLIGGPDIGAIEYHDRSAPGDRIFGDGFRW